MTPRDERRLHSLFDQISRATDQLEQARHTITRYLEAKQKASEPTPPREPERISAVASSLKQTAESFRTDERAWVEIDRIERENRGKGAFRYRLYAKTLERPPLMKFR